MCRRTEARLRKSPWLDSCPVSVNLTQMDRVTTPGPPDIAEAPLAMIAANATSTSVQTVLVIAWRGTLGGKGTEHFAHLLM